MAKESAPDNVKFTAYIPSEVNEALDLIRYKQKVSKNQVILAALNEYLPGQLKKYPEGSDLLK